MTQKSVFVIGILAVGVFVIVLFWDTVGQYVHWLFGVLRGDLGVRVTWR